MTIRTLYALALILALVIALPPPVAAQPATEVAGPGSNEAVKKRALWTDCFGMSLITHVDSDTDLAEEGVWNAAEAALRSARVYYQDPTYPEARSRWKLKVLVFGVGPANYVETGLSETVSGDEGGVYTVMTYRTQFISVNADGAKLLAKVREQMDTFLVDYLRANSDCVERSR